ncbi:MAG TPA: pyridoxamine 5'-phosphate oxidase [Acidimicrobiales bacterium]|nr:pyridoxamine 5'-phosphate oxidase [Acidimicrobiales bacterium]
MVDRPEDDLDAVLQTRREQYEHQSLDVGDVDPDPVEQVRRWTAEWAEVAPREPAAAVLATAGADGRATARNVLVRALYHDGCAFFTNYESRKAQHLAATGHAALLFSWVPVQRQIELVGPVAKLDRAESEAYFATRPRGSQVAAWASAQSTVLPDRAALEALFAEAEARFGDGPVPCPPHWGGYRLVPETIELWQGRPDRLHDRLRYTRDATRPAGWRLERLSP